MPRPVPIDDRPLADRLRDQPERSVDLRLAAVAYRRLLFGTGVLVAVFAAAMLTLELLPTRWGDTARPIAGGLVIGPCLFTAWQIATVSRGLGDGRFTVAALVVLMLVVPYLVPIVAPIQVSRVRRCFARHGLPLPAWGYRRVGWDRLRERFRAEDAAV